jgi:MFS family permease
LSREPGRAGLGGTAASWLVFITSGAVLILEILSLRLVAPYLGLTLETNSAVIGFALAAIAVGASLGGKAADRTPPSKLIGPAILLAGVLVLFVGPIVRLTGEQVRGRDASAVLLITAVAILPPAALLSAVTPMVIKLRLATLDETGRTVGRLSGVGTLGALVATFATGFLLVAKMPTTVILVTLGVFLIVMGFFVTVRLRGVRAAAGPLLLAILGLLGSTSSAPPCDVETAYHCAIVVPDQEHESGRILQLDTLLHSYVDLADPTHLRFSYIRGVSSAVDATLPPGALDALHIGGGGVSYPRYLDATRPGTRNLVLEIDRGVIELDQAKLGLRLGDGIDVRIQDARVGLAQEPPETRDLVVGDAFGGLAVPWHLTTRETVADIRRVLRPDGLYAVNVIDYPPLSFARAEVATITDVFEHVAVIARPEILAKAQGGNLVLVASDAPLPLPEIRAQLARQAPELDLIGRREQLDEFRDDAGILTDDYAPVDQLVTNPGIG